MTNLSSFILMAILAVGLTYFYKYYYFDEEYKKAFGVIIATFIMLFIFSFVFIKVNCSQDSIDIKKVKTELVSDKKTTEVFAAKKVYRDGEDGIIEDDGGYKIVVNLYGWDTEVYYNGKREDGVKVNGLYWYTTHLNQIKNKEKFVKTKIFKSKDGVLVGVEIILEDNKHKKDFEVNY